jgi:mono/diheme cytochrome c family protein
VTKLVNSRIVKATRSLAIAACVSAPFVVAAYGDTLPAIGQAPAVGQAPATVGQAPADVGQAPPAIGQAPPAIGQAPSAVGQAPSAAAPASTAPTQMAAGDKPVSYSTDQANRGKATYGRLCVDCHGDDLRGGLIGGAPLRGSAFDAAFANGSPVSNLYQFIATQMPPDSPGQLSPTNYLELTAYILQQNGYQAGAALPSDPDALDHLLVQK